MKTGEAEVIHLTGSYPHLVHPLKVEMINTYQVSRCMDYIFVVENPAIILPFAKLFFERILYIVSDRQSDPDTVEYYQ